MPPPPQSSPPKWAKFVTITRDPRDMLVSAAFYLANLPEEKGGWGSGFGSLNIKSRLVRLIGEADFLRHRLQAWNNYPGGYHMRYESLLKNPEAELENVQIFLNRDVETGRIKRAIEFHAFKHQSGRESGVEHRSAFLRKGIQGDWRNYFDDDVRQEFKMACNGKWNKLVLDLGYETIANW
ncbi:sulfotransferase domain-containing protein [Pseudomonadota bacterium]